jgi:hypothetical protein
MSDDSKVSRLPARSLDEIISNSMGRHPAGSQQQPRLEVNGFDLVALSRAIDAYRDAVLAMSRAVGAGFNLYQPSITLESADGYMVGRIYYDHDCDDWRVDITDYGLPL